MPAPTRPDLPHTAPTHPARPAPVPPGASLAESVADIPAARPAGIGTLARVMLAGGLAGLLLGSEPLSTWAQNKPEAPPWLLDATAGWNDAMARLGLARLYPALRGAVERARGDGAAP